MALTVCVLGGCASRTQRPPIVAPSPPAEDIVGTSAPEATEDADARRVALWQVPQEEWGSQRLFRARFSTPEGNGRFKLTLHYSDPDRFQISATDPLGRSQWSLFVADSEALLLDHRNKRACAFEEELDLSSLYLGSFPVRSLPNLLLGRLPAAPRGIPAWTAIGGDQVVTYQDEAARRWTARLVSKGSETDGAAGPFVESWSVKEPSGTPRAELSRDEDGWVLLDQRQDLELRWRQVVSELFAGPVELPEIPSRYEQGDCLAPSP